MRPSPAGGAGKKITTWTSAARSPAVSGSREVASNWSAVPGMVPVAASRIRWARRVGQAAPSLRLRGDRRVDGS